MTITALTPALQAGGTVTVTAKPGTDLGTVSNTAAIPASQPVGDAVSFKGL